jgi:hypothetical protein
MHAMFVRFLGDGTDIETVLANVKILLDEEAMKSLFTASRIVFMNLMQRLWNESMSVP